MSKTPPNNREQWIVRHAQERASGDRAAFLDGACAEDMSLRQRVEALLGGQLAVIPPTVKVESADDRPEEAEGLSFGRYKLLEKLGEGGFGAVWLAEQKEPVRRKVALKIIKLGMDTKQVVARFEAERQALALMDHPNIAKVLDAGTTDTGRPYFVMELVRGIRITDYCDQSQLPTKERLDLFIKVCQAIQHAHQKGIIHRDIKPSNILVTLHDGVPVPKVIDFGIAKATQGELTDKTIHTQFQQFIGTPAYMSPEQAEMSGLDIDTRSDIYSLGVLLYELLVGSTPFDAEELIASGIDAMRKTIREKEPVRPSTRLATLQVEELRTRAKHRSSDAPKLIHLLKGDLDWIVIKCLEKNRSRRYETANGLAADITRHLTSEPVVARPPSNIYRFQKLVRRNRLAFAAITGVATMLVVGVVGISMGLLRAERERAKAEGSAKRATEASGEAHKAQRLAETYAADLETSLYYNLIALASDASTSEPANVEESEKRLKECAPRLRDWEWHYLKRRRFADPLVLHDPGNKMVHSISFSPDGQFLASAGGNGALRIWDVETGKVITTLFGHTGAIASVTFNPKHSNWVASAGTDKQLKLWDWRTRKELNSWPCDMRQDNGMAYSVSFSPDGRALAAPAENGEVIVRQTDSGQVLLRLAGHERNAMSVCFSPDGHILATGSSHGSVRLWDATTGQALNENGPVDPPVSGIAFSRDGRRLAAILVSGLLKIWEVAGWRQICSFRPAGELLNGLAFHPTGERVFAGGFDRLVTLSEVVTGRQVLVFKELGAGCYDLAMTSDGNRLAAACGDGTIHLWDATPLRGNEDESRRTLEYPGEAFALAAASDGRKIAVGGERLDNPPKQTAPVLVWNTPEAQAPVRFPGYSIIAFSLAFDPTGRWLASVGDEAILPGRSHLKVWDMGSGKEAFSAEPYEGDEIFFSVLYSRDGQRLVAAGTDGKIKVWNATTGRRIGVLGSHNEGTIMDLALSIDGRYLASASAGDIAKVWDAARLDEPQQPIRELKARCGHIGDTIGLSPDGSRLVVTTDDNTATIHDLKGEDRSVRLVSPGHRPLALVFSLDGRWVASGGTDCTVKLWDAQSGLLQHTFKSHTGQISRLRFFERDAQLWLASSSRDNTVKLWELSRINER